MTERRILIVDDDPDLLETLRVLLEVEGQREVRAVETAAEARRLLSSDEPFDLIISDLRLGEEYGIDLLREALGLRPGLPRILLTGYGPEGIARSGIRAGDADHIFQKDLLIAGRKEFVATVAELSGGAVEEAAPAPAPAPVDAHQAVAAPGPDETTVEVPADWWGLVPDPFGGATSAGPEMWLPADWWGLLPENSNEPGLREL
ncbi:MAG: response regulator [Euryarchaeota archaeon]|nr:response regulator [Euryarchaeota archaeon]